MVRAVILSMRPTQWTKNVVVLAALVFALGDRSQLLDPGRALLHALAAMVFFCLVSGAIYLMNDVKDAAHDRLHPVKKHRPVASGRLPPPAAISAAVVLFTGSVAGAWFIVPELAGVLLLYAVMQVFYTLGLKNIALVDVFVIAAGFVLRALAGAVAIRVIISPWLLICTLLLALFLALCKRRQELVAAHASGQTRDSLKGYDQKLLDQLISMTGSATLISYSLYTLWPDTVLKFGTHGLSFTIPFVAFGLFRYMDLVYRHDQGERPEQVLLTDPPLITAVILYGLTAIAVIMIG